MGVWDRIRDRRVKRSLKASEKDGLFWAVMFGFGETFMSPFAVALKATAPQMAMLASLPHLLSSTIQPLTVNLVDSLRQRKRIVLAGVMLQSLIWLPLFCLPVLFRTRAIPLLLVFYTLYFMLARFAGPAWISWMGDLVPEKLRGEYFGHRNTVIQVATVVSTFAAGAFLGLFQARGEMLGFGVIFMVALLARMISGAYLNMMEEPSYNPAPEDRFTILEFVRGLPKSNYGRFVFFYVVFRFCTAVSAPFFTLYMLRDLGMPYVAYTITILAETLAKVFTIRYWGRYGDRFGNMKIIRVTAMLIPFVPMLWLFSTRLWWLVLLHLFTGLVWGGFDLASANFLFDSVKSAKRARVFAYHDSLQGAFFAVGGLLGGLIVTRLPVLPGQVSYIPTIFLLSGMLRLLTASAFLPWVREVRKVEHVTGAELLFVHMAIEPLEDIAHGAFHGARHGARLIWRLNQRDKNAGVKKGPPH